jgi:uncharacterized protein (TIGR02453 family)
MSRAQHSRIDADWESCTLIDAAHEQSWSHVEGRTLAKPEPIFTQETFRFFRDLARHNQKTWMDANRERYQDCVVKPFRRLLEATAPAVLALDPRFDTAAPGGRNFSRINRDTRFAKDKTPYRPQMYLKFCAPFPGDGESGELYAAVSAKTVTAGFRIYAGSKYKESALAQIAFPRVIAESGWSARQKKRLSGRYESYWYAVEKGEWKEQAGWPAAADDWKKLRAWVVRRKLPVTAATRSSFASEVGKVFRDVYPLLRFTSLKD